MVPDRATAATLLPELCEFLFLVVFNDNSEMSAILLFVRRIQFVNLLLFKGTKLRPGASRARIWLVGFTHSFCNVTISHP